MSPCPVIGWRAETMTFARLEGPAATGGKLMGFASIPHVESGVVSYPILRAPWKIMPFPIIVPLHEADER